MVEKKVVSINPDFFKLTKTNTTRKNRPDGPRPPALKVKSPNPPKEKTSKTIKKNLLNYIRQQQQKNYDELTKPKPPPISKPMSVREPPPNSNSDFKDSLDYLMKLTKENEKKQHANRTIRNPLHVPIVPTQIHHPIQHTNENVSMSLPVEFISPPPQNSPPIHINPPRTSSISLPNPQYGCMKNGSLPTYRNWMHNKTQKNYGGMQSHSPIVNQSISNTGMNSTIGSSQQELAKERLFREKVEELKRRSAINPIASSPQYSASAGSRSDPIKTKLAQINYGKKLEQNKKANKKRIPKRQKTLRRTYRVGKSRVAPKVSVLVSNKTIRKNIYTQALLLKQTPIKEVKRYLIKNGFIRVGSIAPNDVLRRMYENARLVCGELKNHNPDNLLYNFLHGEGEENK